jgi:hypothetical protein
LPSLMAEVEQLKSKNAEADLEIQILQNGINEYEELTFDPYFTPSQEDMACRVENESNIKRVLAMELAAMSVQKKHDQIINALDSQKEALGIENIKLRKENTIAQQSLKDSQQHQDSYVGEIKSLLMRNDAMKRKSEVKTLNCEVCEV